MGQLGNALFTVTQQNVLGLLYAQPGRSFYTKEILRITGMGVATIKRELDRMVEAGILDLTKIGNQHHYQANPDCPIYVELLSIVRKTFGIADVLRSALEPINALVVYAFIYGSIAKGTEKTKSDIDLMLIGSELSYTGAMDLLIPIEEKLGRSINPTVYSVLDFKKQLKEKNNFLTRVMQQEKIFIMGSEGNIGKT